jgi:hypothetical protein
MSRSIVELCEAFQRKFNPSGSDRDARVANREIGNKVKELLEAKKLIPQKVSFRALYEALVGPIQNRELSEAGNLASSAFPNIAGQIISKVLIDGYEEFPKDVDQLCRTVPSKLKTSRVVGWSAIGFVQQVNEKEDYPEILPPDEKLQTIKNLKYGGMISLTREDIFFDQTGELIDRARMIGQRGAQKRASLIFGVVCDGSGTPAGGTALSGAALYTSGNKNLKTANPLGQSGWETSRKALYDMTDEQGEPIWVLGDKPKMIVGSTLLATAEKLMKNPNGDLGTANRDVNLAQNQFDIVINPYLPSTSSWWYGAPQRQFRWEEVWPLETFTRVGQDSEVGFNQDLIQQFKLSFYGGAGAADYRYMIENDPT